MKSNIIPITGKHLSLFSLLSQIMGDKTQKTGIIFSFDDEGTMSFGHFGMTRAQTCMAAICAQDIAMNTMQQMDGDPDE